MNDSEMDAKRKRLRKAVDAYCDKFEGLPIGWELTFGGPKDEDSCAAAIYKAIEENKPFPEEGVFWD